MKLALATICLLATSLTSTAFANQGEKQVSTESLEILDAVSHCAIALDGLASAGRIGGATIQNNEDLDVYTISFVTGGYAPTFQTELVGKLVVTKSFQRSNIQAPDAPGGQMVYNCSVSTK